MSLQTIFKNKGSLPSEVLPLSPPGRRKRSKTGKSGQKNQKSPLYTTLKQKGFFSIGQKYLFFGDKS
jgi:hypothetical protein